MQIKSISVSVEMTINMGDYSNLRPGVSLSADLDAGDDPAEAARKLKTQARVLILDDLKTDLESQVAETMENYRTAGHVTPPEKWEANLRRGFPLYNWIKRFDTAYVIPCPDEPAKPEPVRCVACDQPLDDDGNCVNPACPLYPDFKLDEGESEPTPAVLTDVAEVSHAD